ncbi:MAG TPA: hypothetical protein VGK09_01845 [Rhodocyclaceae bacterium]|jgi:hypothetical protein
MTTENYLRGPSLQSVLASLLWSLGSLPIVPACPRQRAIVTHQLRYVQGHPETESLMRDVVSQLLAQFEDEQAHRQRTLALDCHSPLAAQLSH